MMLRSMMMRRGRMSVVMIRMRWLWLIWIVVLRSTRSRPGPQPVDITLNSDELLVPHTEGFDRFDFKRIEEAFLQDQGFLAKSFSCSAEAC